MPKILIIEDDEDVRSWMSETLKRAGYDVDAQPDGEGAVRQLTMGTADLVVIDYHLPGRTGLQLLSDIRAAQLSTPVIIATADGSQQVAVQCFRAGAQDFISKPIDGDFLKIVVRRTLESHAHSLKDSALRALCYTQHKPDCQFHTDGRLCTCGLKEVCDDIQAFQRQKAG